MKSRTTATLVLVAAIAAGCGGGGNGGAAKGPVGGPGLGMPVDSVWVPGQPSLSALPAYESIASRAIPLAQAREHAHTLELAHIEAAKRAAARRAKAEALRKYREAKRRAELAYKRALKRAAELRRQQARRLAALRRKRARELAALRRKLRVKPGEECKIPEVAAKFHCKTGMTPLAKPLPRK